MFKKINKVILVAVIVLVLLGIEGYILRSTINFEPTSKILALNQDIEKGTMITEDMLCTKDIKILNTPKNAISEIDDVIQQYANKDLYEGEFLIDKMLSSINPEKNIFNIKKGSSLVTIKFDSSDAANGWIIQKNQKIHILFSPFNNQINEEETELFKLFYDPKDITATIKDIKDENLISIGEEQFNYNRPMYVTFEVSKEDANFIIHAKDKGRLEIYVGDKVNDF